MRRPRSRTDRSRKSRAAELDHGIPQKDLSKILIRRGVGIFPVNLCQIEQGNPIWTTDDTAADLLDIHIADLARHDKVPAARTRREKRPA